MVFQVVFREDLFLYNCLQMAYTVRDPVGGSVMAKEYKKVTTKLTTLSIFYYSNREKKSRVALNFYLKVMAPWWLLYD